MNVTDDVYSSLSVDPNTGLPMGFESGQSATAPPQPSPPPIPYQAANSSPITTQIVQQATGAPVAPAPPPPPQPIPYAAAASSPLTTVQVQQATGATVAPPLQTWASIGAQPTSLASPSSWTAFGQQAMAPQPTQSWGSIGQPATGGTPTSIFAPSTLASFGQQAAQPGTPSWDSLGVGDPWDTPTIPYTLANSSPLTTLQVQQATGAQVGPGAPPPSQMPAVGWDAYGFSPDVQSVTNPLAYAGILGSAKQSYGLNEDWLPGWAQPVADLALSPLGLASVIATGGAGLGADGAAGLASGLGTGAAEDLAGSAGAIYAPKASNALLNATSAPGWLYGPVNTAAMLGGALAGGKLGQVGAEAAPGAARALGGSLAEFPSLDVAAPVKPLSEADFVFPPGGAIDPATGQPFPMQDIAGGAASPEDQIAALKNAGYSDADIASLQGALSAPPPGPTLVQQVRGLVQQYKQVMGKDAFSPEDSRQLYQMAGRVAKGSATPEESAQVSQVMDTLQGVVDQAKTAAAAAAKPRFRIGPDGLRQIDPLTGEEVPVETPTPEGAIPETPAANPAPLPETSPADYPTPPPAPPPDVPATNPAPLPETPAPLPETPAPISQEGALSAAGAEGGVHTDEYAGLYRQLRDQGVTDAEARQYLGYDKNTPSPAYEGDGATVEPNEPPRRKVPGGNGQQPPTGEAPPPNGMGPSGAAPTPEDSATVGAGQKRGPIDTFGDMMRQAAVVGHVGIVSLHGFTTMLTHPTEWAADVGSALKAVIKPEVADELRAARVKNYDAIQPGAADALKKAGLRVFGSNSGDLYKTPLNKIPVVGNIFERNDAFYNAATESFRDDAAQRMLKLQRKLNEAKTGDATITPKQFQQIADAANHLTGTTTRSMGTFANTLFWAPRLLSSEVAMVGDAFTKGGAGGAVARRMVAQTAAEVFGGIIAYNMATSHGKDVWGPGYGLKDFPQAVKSGKLFSINVKGQTLRPLGLFYSPVQTAASLVADAINKDPAAAEQDSLYFLRDHLSPLISLALDIYTGKDYAGKPVTLQGKITDSVPIIGQQGYDIAKEAQKGLWGQTVADTLNTIFNIHPKTPSAYDQRDANVAKFLQEHPDLVTPGSAVPKTYYDLSPSQKKAFDSEYGKPAPTTPGGQALAAIDQERLARESGVAADFNSGKITAQQFRDQIGHISYAADQKRSQADADLKIFQTTGKLPSDPNKAALAQYYAILDDPSNQYHDGELNYDAIDPKMQTLSNSLTEDQRQYINNNTGLTSHDPTVKELKDTQSKADSLGYWNIGPDTWKQLAASVPALAKYPTYGAAQAVTKIPSPLASTYSKLVSTARLQFVQKNPALAKELIKFGYLTPTKAESAALGIPPK